MKVTAYEATDQWAAFGFRRTAPGDWYTYDHPAFPTASGYMVYYRQNGEILLYQDQEGNLAAAQTNKDLSAWRHVKIAALADRIKVWVDGTLFIDYYEPSPPYTTGYVAFYSQGVNPKFDNLVVSNLGTQQKTYYIYSGDVPIAEYDAGGALLAEYVYANGQRVAKINPDGTMHYYLTDHLGSTRVVYGSNWNANYHAYGEVAAQSGSDAENKYTFTGKEKDSGTGLTYFGWRYYDPVLGRWLTLDPAGQGWSPYAYAGNNPVIMIDPDGRIFWVVAGAAIGAYLGASMTNNWQFDPGKWAWNNGKTYAGLVIGAVVGGYTGANLAYAYGTTGIDLSLNGIKVGTLAKGGAIAGGIAGAGYLAQNENFTAYINLSLSARYGGGWPQIIPTDSWLDDWTRQWMTPESRAFAHWSPPVGIGGPWLYNFPYIAGMSATNQPWDMKPKFFEMFKDEDLLHQRILFEFQGNNYRYDEIGNIAWGRIMAYHQIDPLTATAGAGIFQMYEAFLKGESKPVNFPFGDDIRDTRAILRGYWWYYSDWWRNRR